MTGLGLLLFCTDESAPAPELARAAEGRGVESLWVPEHSHIPAARLTPTPLGNGRLPREYSRLYDPFLTLSAMAAVTEHVRLGTGVTLVANHDPIVLAKQVATLDRLSDGRFVLGVGAGWNREEIENHGVEFETRWKRAAEHLEAMRAIWAEDEASYSGRWTSFDRIWSWPKPMQQPHPPILIGTINPSPLVVRLGTGWLPLSLAHPGQLPERIQALHVTARERGVDPASLDVTVFCLEPTSAADVRGYGEAGATRVVLKPPTESLEALTGFLDQYQPVLAA